MPALAGVVMELDDCAFPLLAGVEATSSLATAFDGASWVLLVGSVPRKAGMERGDLLPVNGGIFKPQGEAIAANAASDVRVLVVGNPCNTNCLIARSNAPDVPADRWFAMTRLDQNRAISQLAQRAGVSVPEVANVAIWGNHSATQYPDFENATIGGVTATSAIGDERWLQGDFLSTVRKRGAAIIEARGASSAASAASAAIDTVVSLTTATAAEHLRLGRGDLDGGVRRARGADLRLPDRRGRPRRLVGQARLHALRVRRRAAAGDHHRGSSRSRDEVRSLGLI